jgi:hypothetical protein
MVNNCVGIKNMQELQKRLQNVHVEMVLIDNVVRGEFERRLNEKFKNEKMIVRVTLKTGCHIWVTDYVEMLIKYILESDGLIEKCFDVYLDNVVNVM